MSETSRAHQNRSEMNVIFVHSELDDRNLTQAEFRVYCHLARRAGTGVAFPGIDSMAKICCMGKNTVIAAINELESQGMITANRQPGVTTQYILTKLSQWKPLPKEGRSENTTITDQVTERPFLSNATVPNQVTKGNPTKEIQKSNPVARRKFQKPTMEEVRAAITKAGLPAIEADKFMNYYESNGWKVGRNPMISWPHAIGNWSANFRSNPRMQPAAPQEQERWV